MILSFILGVCVMPVYTFIAICLIDDGKNWGVFLCGPAAWTVFIFRFMAESVRCWKRDHNKRPLLLDENDCIYAVLV